MFINSSKPEVSQLVVSVPLPLRLRPAPPELIRVPTLEGFASLFNRELGSARRNGAEPALLMMSLRSLVVEARAANAEQIQAVLTAMGERLRARVRSNDVVVQIGARRFGVVLQNMAGAKPGAVQQRLQQQLSGAYEHRHECLSLALNMAWARSERGGQESERCRLSAEELLQAADAALQAEGQGPVAEERRSRHRN
ncbi:GGDEF domain-containing protein [Paucibacter oligotrophus]|uniref:GGDEF domain-containing protein n=1 Tax=Roseateles oligotrophus TaxID=1769250 RepID=A0A840L9A1_9BURK|nr:diguanylate cyclase [Roseateles oligotrophus]MBB4843252.1 GGDEF domain-containing protein [Roseateles oligotrophus]